MDNNEARINYGQLSLDDAGQISQGQIHFLNGTTAAVESGTLTLDSRGTLGGSMVLEGGTSVTFQGGAMTGGKTTCSFVTRDSNQWDGLGLMNRSGGVYDTGDLEGTWHCHFIIYGVGFAGSGAMSAWGPVSVDAAGQVTQGQFTLSDSSTALLTDGILAIDSQGTLSGNFKTDSGDTLTIVSGHLNTDKSSAALVVNNDTYGFDYFGSMIKDSGSFAPSDMAGSWNLAFIFRNVWSLGNQWVEYGTIEVDTSGAVTGGTMLTTGGHADSISDGQLSLDSSGVLSGFLNMDGLDPMTIVSGKVDATKTIAVALQIENSAGTIAILTKSDTSAAGNGNGGYTVASDLWLKAVLQPPSGPVTLVWNAVGADTTPSGDRVISGYFYADPNDFAYGSRYNPEVFVKIYIATNGWANIAFNHVTVDDVAVDSAHNFSGRSDITGCVTLNNRLAEHQYSAVDLE